MKRLTILILLLSFTVPSFASTHKSQYDVSCNELWRAVKDTLKNSGKYGIISIDNAEMTASYNIGGSLTGKRINSAILNGNSSGHGCELQVQTAYSGLVNNDFGDFKKRLDESLTKLKSEPLAPSESASTPVSAAPAQASLAIESTPAGADIEIDGAFMGSTPSTLTLAPGVHEIAVKKKGFAAWTRKVNVTGGTVHLNAELEQTPAQ